MTPFEIISVVLSVLAFIISGLAVWYTRKQYLIGIKPNLWCNTLHIKQIEREVIFDLTNRENLCHINKVKVKSKNLIHHSDPCPWDLEQGESMNLSFCYVGKEDINKDEYKIRIDFSDKANNSYHGYLIKQRNGKYFFKE